MYSHFLGASLLATTLAAAGEFQIKPVTERSLGIWEGDQAVMVYNHGMMLKDGVPADRTRSSYVHPLYGVDGEVLSDDFPRDHYHHRGLFWAWPHVKVGNQDHSLWDLKGVRHEFTRFLEQKTAEDGAILAVENSWIMGEDRIVSEKIRFHVHPAADGARAIDVDFAWTPLKAPLTLEGADGKGYGGLTLRFAPGDQTVITTPEGVAKEDTMEDKFAWTDLTRHWKKENLTSGAAIFVHPSHPGFPPLWLTRHYGVLCLSWPGVQAETFPAGKTVRCRYRVWTHRGVADAKRLAQAYQEYKEYKEGASGEPATGE